MTDYKEMREAMGNMCAIDHHHHTHTNEKQKTGTTEKNLDARFDEAVKIFNEIERRGLMDDPEKRAFYEAEFKKFVVDGETVAFDLSSTKGWKVFLFNAPDAKSGIKAG